MSVQLPVLEDIRIASPCDVPWSEMKGDNRIRHCDQCALDVYNFSSMTRDEVETLVRNHRGRLCGAYYQRSDGTMLVQDCPVGLAAIRKRTARLVASFGTLVAGVLTFASLGMIAPNSYPVRSTGLFKRIANWIDPPPPIMPALRGSVAVLGKVMATPPPVSGTTGTNAPLSMGQVKLPGGPKCETTTEQP